MRMTKDGKIAAVPADKVEEMLRRNWAPVPEGETEGGDMSVGEPAAPVKPTNPVADAGKAFATGASRWATLGMDDEASGVMTGLLEAFSPTSLSDEGDDVLTRLEKGYRQGKQDRRALVDDLSKRSPQAYNTGAGAGAGLAAALTPATAGARVLAAGIAGPGIADIDLGRRDAPAAAARSVGAGLVGGAVVDKAASVIAPAVSKAVTAATEKLQALQPGAREAAIDALDAIVKAGGPKAAMLKKVDDVVKGAASTGLGKLRTPPAPTAPAAPPAPPVYNSFAEAMAQQALARRLGGLVDEPMPTMPPRNPRTPADQIPRVAPPMPAPAPAPGAAVPLSDAELQAMIRGVNSSPQMRQLERVQQQMTRAPGVATDPLDEMSKRLIRQGNASTSNTNPVAIDDVGGRAPKVVAAVGQQEKWRGIYDRLSPDQRASFIEQLRRESGLTDDQIRQRLKLTMAEWRRKSFTREAP
jgi:hypothetical protein